MSTEAKSTGLYWLITIVSLIATIALIMFIPEWFWVTLPFLFTAFTKAMDWM